MVLTWHQLLARSLAAVTGQRKRGKSHSCSFDARIATLSSDADGQDRDMLGAAGALKLQEYDFTIKHCLGT